MNTPFLCFLILFGSIEATSFKHAKKFSVNNNGSEPVDYAEVLVVINTKELIEEDELTVDCRDFLFFGGEKYDIPLLFYLQGGCNSENTIFWVKFSSLPVGNSDLFFFYGNDQFSNVHTAYRKSFSGDFLVFADSETSCQNEWVGSTDLYGDRFVLIGSTEEYGDTGGTNSLHPHTLSGYTDDHVPPVQFEPNGFATDVLYVGDHSHQFYIDTEEVEILPPSKCVKMCSSSDLHSFPTGFVLPFLDTSSVTSEWEIQSEFDGNYGILCEKEDYGTVHSTGEHQHVQKSGDVFVTEKADGSIRTGFAHNSGFNTRDHIHQVSFDDALQPFVAPDLPFKNVVFSKVISSSNIVASSLSGSTIVILADGVPPMGFENAAAVPVGRFLRGSLDGVGGDSQTNWFDTHNHGGTYEGSITVDECTNDADNGLRLSGFRSTRAHSHTTDDSEQPSISNADTLQITLPPFVKLAALRIKSSFQADLVAAGKLCYGKFNNDASQCSGNGRCEEVDSCVCDEGYFNDDCSGWNCFGIEQGASKVCGGAGDVCECDDPGIEEDDCVEGSDIDPVFCFGVLSSENDACSNMGRCVKNDKCKCEVGWSGRECSDGTPRAVLASSMVSGGVLVGVIFLFLLCCLSYIFVLYLKKKRIAKKVEGVDDIELILEEHRIEQDDSIPHLKVNKDLFQVNYEDVKLISHIGEGGGNAIIYKAEWSGQVVAFKVFTMSAFGQNSFEEFEKELSIFSSVNHPNLLQFYGASMKQPRMGLLMEYCENGDLYSYFTKNTTLMPFETKVGIIEQVVCAIEYLHQRNVVHRDVKMQNILLTTTFTPKVIDFGLSRIVSGNDKMTIRRGTPVTMAPEVSLGLKNYDNKVDVFSLSIVIFQMLIDVEPYSRNEMQGIEFKVSKGLRPTIPDQFSQEHPKISGLIQKSWDQDPNVRPTAGELRKEFKEIVLALSMEESPDMLDESFWNKERISGLLKRNKELEEENRRLRDVIKAK